jgi:hypothetical protein
LLLFIPFVAFVPDHVLNLFFVSILRYKRLKA